MYESYKHDDAQKTQNERVQPTPEAVKYKAYDKQNVGDYDWANGIQALCVRQ